MIELEGTTPTIDELRAAHGGQLPAWAWPGGYPMYYMDEDGSEFCTSCANQDDAEPAIRYWGINWEDPDLYCSGGCGRIESAYAED